MRAKRRLDRGSVCAWRKRNRRFRLKRSSVIAGSLSRLCNHREPVGACVCIYI